MEKKIEDQLNTDVRLQLLSTHEILEIHDAPYFRVMKVHSGWLYNFYNTEIDEYLPNWVFVPQHKLD